MRNQKGATLIEVMVVAGIMAILALGTLHIVDMMMRENKRFRLKAELLDVRNSLARSLSEPGVCTYNFKTLNPISINETQITNPNYVVPLNQIVDNEAPTATPNVLVKVDQDLNLMAGPVDVEEIWLADFQKVRDGLFTANFHVRVKSDSSTLAPLSVSRVRIRTEGSVPTAQSVAKCGAGESLNNDDSNCVIRESPTPTDNGLEHLTCEDGEYMKSGGGRCVNEHGQEWSGESAADFGYVSRNNPWVDPVTGRIGWEIDCFAPPPDKARSKVVLVCCKD